MMEVRVRDMKAGEVGKRGKGRLDTFFFSFFLFLSCWRGFFIAVHLIYASSAPDPRKGSDTNELGIWKLILSIGTFRSILTSFLPCPCFNFFWLGSGYGLFRLFTGLLKFYKRDD